MIIYAIQFEDGRSYEDHITILEPVFLNKEMAVFEMEKYIQEFCKDGYDKGCYYSNQVAFSIRELSVKE